MWINSNKPILVLAPMADMTDSPFCCVCREIAGEDFVIFREMASAEAIVRDSAKTLTMCEFNNIERPIVIQLFGADPKVVRQAARIVVDKFHPDGIDINMGCPVPKIAGKAGSGAALMKDCGRATTIIRELKKENLGVPISVKTRLGWSGEEEILDFAPQLEDAGADAIIIHGRTKAQGYSGQANWEMIGKVKKLVKIPVIANGDIVDTKSVQRCLEVTGADGVMVGRRALGNPWVFISIFHNPYPITQEERVRIVKRHAELHVAHYGERGIVTFRKHLAWYFKANKIGTGVPNVKELRSKLVRVNSPDELSRLLSYLPRL